MNKIKNLEGRTRNSEYKNSVGKEIFKVRIDLHRAIEKRMRNIGICSSPPLVESFKRWYLWNYHSVETSKALSMVDLKNAITMLADVTAVAAVDGMMQKFNIYQQQKEILRQTGGQRNKIIAIAKYQLKLQHDGLKKYAEKRLGRDVYISKYFALDITVAEAHELIQQLEKWEAKVIRGKK